MPDIRLSTTFSLYLNKYKHTFVQAQAYRHRTFESLCFYPSFEFNLFLCVRLLVLLLFVFFISSTKFIIMNYFIFGWMLFFLNSLAFFLHRFFYFLLQFNCTVQAITNIHRSYYAYIHGFTYDEIHTIEMAYVQW